MSDSAHATPTVLTEVASKELLKQYNIPVAGGEVGRSRDECTSIAKRIGYPVVLKILSEEIIHKSDVGGVRVGLRNPNEVGMAYDGILHDVRTHSPRAKIEGILVQEHIEDGVEVIIGTKEDETFGTIVLFGLGGVFAELLNDFTTRVVPFSEADAREMIEEVEGAKILHGFRSRKESDIDSLVRIIMDVQRLLNGDMKVREMDLNPVIVRERPRGAIVADARIVLG